MCQSPSSPAKGRAVGTRVPTLSHSTPDFQISKHITEIKHEIGRGRFVFLWAVQLGPKPRKLTWFLS